MLGNSCLEIHAWKFMLGNSMCLEIHAWKYEGRKAWNNTSRTAGNWHCGCVHYLSCELIPTYLPTLLLLWMLLLLLLLFGKWSMIVGLEGLLSWCVYIYMYVCMCVGPYMCRVCVWSQTRHTRPGLWKVTIPEGRWGGMTGLDWTGPVGAVE
jgi:hypothetical protein